MRVVVFKEEEEESENSPSFLGDGSCRTKPMRRERGRGNLLGLCPRREKEDLFGE